MSGGGAGAALPPPGAGAGMGAMGGAAGGAMGGLGAAGGAAGGPGAMAGGWQMPAITGGTSSLYAAPGATGAMAPPSPNWLQDHPQVRNAMLQFGQSLLAQRAAGAQGAMGGPGISRGQWRPPQMHPGLPQSSSLPGPDTGAMGGPIGGMQQYAGGFNGQVGDPNTYAQLPITPNQSNMPGIGRFSNATPPPWMMGRGGGAMGGAAGGGMMGGGGPFWGGM